MPDDHEMLTTHLAERDEPCPGCAYNLRGLKGTRCPECNQELAMRVGLVEPRHGAYIASMCGLLTGAGMAAVFLGVIAWLLLTRGGGPPRSVYWPLLGIPGVGVVVLGLAAVQLSRRRARVWLRGVSSVERRMVVMASWAATTGLVAWFLSSVM